MSPRKLPIFEPLGSPQRPSAYSYVGKHAGLHMFADETGKRELFARRRDHAGWHLIRGAWVYEFVRSAGEADGVYGPPCDSSTNT